MENIRLIHWISGLILVVILGLTGWSYFQKVQVNQAIASVQEQTQTVQGQLDKIEEQKLDAIIAAQEIVDRVDATSIKWSKVITNLIAVTPLDIFYRSYSAAADGRMNLSVITDTYDAAAHLISILDNDSQFSKPFVGSITRGTTETGGEVVNFGITFNVR